MTLAFINTTTAVPTFESIGSRLADRWYLDFICRRDTTVHLPSLFGTQALTGRDVVIYVISSGIYPSSYFGTRLSTLLGSSGVDYTGHGTGMAFIAAGLKYGVAPRASIVNLNVYDSSGVINPTKYKQAVDLVLAQETNRTKLVLTSAVRTPKYGYLIVQTDLDADTQRLIKAGVIVVAGAGDGLADYLTGECMGPILAEVCHPLHLDGLFVASAIQCDGHFPFFANYGSAVTAFAPGDNIPTLDQNGKWILDSSTRYSAAILTGIIAVYLEKFPYAKSSDLKTFINEHFFTTGNVDRYPLDRLQKDPFESEDLGYLVLRSDAGWPYPYLVDTKAPFRLSHLFFTQALVEDNMISLGSVLANTEFEIPIDIKFKNLYGEVKPVIYKIISVTPENVGQFEIGERSGILFGVVNDVTTSVICTLELGIDDGLKKYIRSFNLHIQPNYLDLYTVGGVIKARLGNISGLDVNELVSENLQIDESVPSPGDKEIPVTRDVRLLKQATGRFIGKTVTPLATGEFLFVVAGGIYQAIVLDQQDEYTGYVIDNLRAAP